MVGNTKRDEIVRQAYGVFYEHGCHATGVDRLLADSGISKRTLYKYFRSKEELVSAAVVHYKETTLTAMIAEISRRTNDPKEKLLAIFDLRREVLESGDYSGCFAINAKLEYEGKNPEIEAACCDFETGFESFIANLCTEARLRNPEYTARQIMVLLEGTIVYGQSQHNPAIASAARDVVQMILKIESLPVRDDGR